MVAAGILGAAGLLGAAFAVGSPNMAPRVSSTTAATSTPTPPTPAPASVVPTPSGVRAGDRSTAAIEAQVAAKIAAAGRHAAVAVIDRVTGTGLAVNGSARFRTASIVKVDILAALMLQQQQKGSTLTKSQQDLAKPMITMSDNAAASNLWRQIGAATGLAAMNRTLQMTETTPGTAGRWGATATTAADQLRLLKAVTDPAGPLSAGHRQYLLDLMSHVTDAQDWGVPAAATSQATERQVKNGWMPFGARNGDWTINTIGRIVEPGHEWLAVVLSDHNPTQSSGVRIVETLARLLIDGLRAVAG